MTYTFSIPKYLPLSANELMRVHWSKRAKAVNDCAELVGAYSTIAQVPKATGRRRFTLKLILGPKNRRRDDDSSFKVCLDACVRCRLLVDDSPTWCELIPLQQEKGRARATVVTLVDLD